MAASNGKKSVDLGQFVRVKDTKNFVRYETQPDDDSRPLTFYVPNTTVAELGDPDTIGITVRNV